MAQAEEAKFYFGVDIDLHNVGVDIRVNDIPVYYDDNRGQLTVEVPAPDSIIDGENNLTVKAFLPFDGNGFVENYAEGAYISATLFKQDLSIPNSMKDNLTKITIKLNNESASSIIDYFDDNKPITQALLLNKDKSVSSSSNLILRSPFPRWAWQDGKVIVESTEGYNSLLLAYKQIHDVLKSNDLDALNYLYVERAKETAIAYNLPNIKAGLRKLSVGNDMMDDQLELYEFHSTGLEFQLFANGRLARLSDDIGAQPILYTQKDGSAVHLYKFMFYLNEDAKWVLIR